MLSNGCCHVLAANVQTSYQVKWNNFTCFNIVRSYFLETSRHYTNHTLTLERYDDLSSYKLIPHFNCKDDKYKQLWWCLHCSGWHCGCFWAGGFYLLNTGCPPPLQISFGEFSIGVKTPLAVIFQCDNDFFLVAIWKRINLLDISDERGIYLTYGFYTMAALDSCWSANGSASQENDALDSGIHPCLKW